MARIGLLGGTFNPPHIGHLVCAQEACDQLRLDRVALVPAPRPPHKEVPDDPGPWTRLRLCELAVEGDERLTVEPLELGRPGPSFTVDTLRELRGRGPGDELTLVVGGDMAASLTTWREPAEILRLATLAVAGREGLSHADIAARLAPLHDGSRVVFFDMPRLDVSSTMLRARAAAGRSLRYLVPDAVADEIGRRGLYRGRRPQETPPTEEQHRA